MADGLSHNRRVALSTVTAQIDGAHTNFPVLFTEANLPSEMFDADGSNPAQNGGGDIRFTSDEAGNNDLPLEVVSFVTDKDPGNGTAILWVKVPNVRDTQIDTVYCWYNTGSSDSQPAVGAANGRNAVWSAADRIYHLEEEQSGVGNANVYIDSTGNDDADDEVSATGQTGKIGAGQEFDGVDDHITASEVVFGSEFAMGGWFFEPTGSHDLIDGTNRRTAIAQDSGEAGYLRLFDERNDGLRGGFRDDGAGPFREVTSTTETTLEQWNRIWLIYDGSALKLYLNGAEDASLSTSSDVEDLFGVDPLVIGSTTLAGDEDQRLLGFADEIQIYATLPSSIADYIATEYNNQNAPGTFISTGTPEDAGGGGGGSALSVNLASDGGLAGQGGLAGIGGGLAG